MRAQTNTMTLKFSHSQMRDAAMRSSGLDPRAIAMKPGTRRQRDRKALAARGHVKHKGQAFM